PRRAPHALASFPTRRSSDLRQGRRTAKLTYRHSRSTLSATQHTAECVIKRQCGVVRVGASKQRNEPENPREKANYSPDDSNEPARRALRKRAMNAANDANSRAALSQSAVSIRSERNT